MVQVCGGGCLVLAVNVGVLLAWGGRDAGDDEGGEIEQAARFGVWSSGPLIGCSYRHVVSG